MERPTKRNHLSNQVVNNSRREVSAEPQDNRPSWLKNQHVDRQVAETRHARTRASNKKLLES